MHKKAACKKIDMTIITASFVENFVPKGRVTTPNRMSFWKISKRPLTPALIFGKLYWKLFVMDMVAFMQGGIGQIVSVNIS